MIPYCGRHPRKQFIRGKPIRWGYRAWVASEPLGYEYHIDMFQGKGECHSSYREPFGLGGAVVLNLIDQIETKYPNLRFSRYFDNYFTIISHR